VRDGNRNAFDLSNGRNSSRKVGCGIFGFRNSWAFVVGKINLIHLENPATSRWFPKYLSKKFFAAWGNGNLFPSGEIKWVAA